MQKIIKAYYLLFYKLYCFFRFTAEEGWEHWKALIVICILEVYLIIELLVWWTILFRNTVTLPKYVVAVPIGLGVVLFNYYFFLYKDRWKVYVEEFKQYSMKKKRITSWLVFLFIIGVIGSVVFAFYQMSLINWVMHRER